MAVSLNVLRSVIGLMWLGFNLGYTPSAWAQQKQCFCAKDTSMNKAIISCETQVLSHGAKLYWQFNCTRIWLTLQQPSGKKMVLDEVPVDLFGYTYRLGYHFIKEFNETVLFRYGCPANGPCVYVLRNKFSGKKVREFSQLIHIDTDVFEDKPYPFDFVVYFSEKNDTLVVHNLNTNKIIQVPFTDTLHAHVPEYQFTNMRVSGTELTLVYLNNDGVEKTILVTLK